MLPLVMEQMPSSSDDALTRSRQYVDDADLYIGVFAFRYGFIPDGQDKSITELEYDRATARRIPTIIFIADKDHRTIQLEDYLNQPVQLQDVRRTK